MNFPSPYVYRNELSYGSSSFDYSRHSNYCQFAFQTAEDVTTGYSSFS